ncbi:MAG: hypothetical protein OEZ43_20540 [Gammaproteobacteria bacterium]|nr:hypothetical protein [Gammaproteobacteria bacterium]
MRISIFILLCLIPVISQADVLTVRGFLETLVDEHPHLESRNQRFRLNVLNAAQRTTQYGVTVSLYGTSSTGVLHSEDRETIFSRDIGMKFNAVEAHTGLRFSLTPRLNYIRRSGTSTMYDASLTSYENYQMNRNTVDVNATLPLVRNMFGSNDRRNLRIYNNSIQTYDLDRMEHIEQFLLKHIRIYLDWNQRYRLRDNTEEFQSLLETIAKSTSSAFTTPLDMARIAELSSFLTQEQRVHQTEYNSIAKHIKVLTGLEETSEITPQYRKTGDIPTLSYSEEDLRNVREMQEAELTIDSAELVNRKAANEKLPGVFLEVQANLHTRSSPAESYDQDSRFIGLRFDYALMDASANNRLDHSEAALLYGKSEAESLLLEKTIQYKTTKSKLDDYQQLLAKADDRVIKATELLEIEMKNTTVSGSSSHTLVEAFIAAYYAQKERIKIEFDRRHVYLDYLDIFDRVYDEADGQSNILIEM